MCLFFRTNLRTTYFQWLLSEFGLCNRFRKGRNFIYLLVDQVQQEILKRCFHLLICCQSILVFWLIQFSHGIIKLAFSWIFVSETSSIFLLILLYFSFVCRFSNGSDSVFCLLSITYVFQSTWFIYSISDSKPLILFGHTASDFVCSCRVLDYLNNCIVLSICFHAESGARRNCTCLCLGCNKIIASCNRDTLCITQKIFFCASKTLVTGEEEIH